MKTKHVFLVSFLALLVSCGTQKKSSFKQVKKYSNSKSEQVVLNAKKYIGTPYKYGGKTKSGMDCSGLVYVSFFKENIVLPRTSISMSNKGKPIKKGSILKGDLLFFKTSKSSKKINHVGVVSEITKKSIFFIHSSSSKGVVESSLNNIYWSKAYRFARRVL